MYKGAYMGERIFGFIEWCVLIPYLIISISANAIKEYFSDKNELKKKSLT
jgi:hypothetical protein